jgi:hypothetical protein
MACALRVIPLLVLISQSSSSAHFSDCESAFVLITYFLVYFFICRTTPLSDSEILNKMYFPVNRKSCAIEKACFQL